MGRLRKHSTINLTKICSAEHGQNPKRHGAQVFHIDPHLYKPYLIIVVISAFPHLYLTGFISVQLGREESK
jgi:hypothetical protein